MTTTNRPVSAPAPETRLDEIARLLGGRKRGTSYQCHCPAHEDHTPSLSVTRGDDGRILLYCHAGCDFDSIAAGLAERGIAREMLAPAPKPQKPASKRVRCRYAYHDADGRLIYETVRLAPKGFYQRRPDGRGGWINNLHGVNPLPYRLPEVRAAIKRDEVIYLVEGEKDADRLAGLGLAATCNHGGAGKWSDDHSTALNGASRVVILPDNDPPGQAHAASASRSLLAAGIPDVRIVPLPGLPPAGDISDWLDQGGRIEALCELIERAPHEAVQVDRGMGPRLLKAHEVMTMPAAKWLIDKEIPAGGLAVLYGDSGSGKSFLALDYALRLANEATVVYVAGEGLAGYPDRLRAWQGHHGQPIDGFHLLDDALPMLDELAVTRFIEMVRPLKPQMIGRRVFKNLLNGYRIVEVQEAKP